MSTPEAATRSGTKYEPSWTLLIVGASIMMCEVLSAVTDAILGIIELVTSADLHQAIADMAFLLVIFFAVGGCIMLAGVHRIRKGRRTWDEAQQGNAQQE